MAEPRENVYNRPLGVIQHLHCHYTVVTVSLLGCKKSAQLQEELQSKRGTMRMWDNQATFIPEEPGRSCTSRRVELAVLLSAYSSLQQPLLFQGKRSSFSVKGTGLWSDLTEIQLAYMQYFLHDSSPRAKAQRVTCPFPEWETSVSWLHTYHMCLAPHEPIPERARQAAWSSAKMDFCRIQQGLDHQPKCGGCKRIEALMQYWTTSQDSRRDGRRPAPHSRPELIHNSYDELDFCAQRCITCRFIRRGLLLNQPMINEVASLGIYPHKVWATMAGAEMEHMTLEVACKPNSNSPGSTFTSTINFCAKGGTSPAEVPLATRADTKVVHGQVIAWADACQRGHTKCGNLNWSIGNPTRLLHITSPSHVQLVDARQDMELVRYTALSYCWWSPDHEEIQLGRTTDDNFASRKSRPFPTTELPATIRDAITMTRGCGLEYI